MVNGWLNKAAMDKRDLWPITGNEWSATGSLLQPIVKEGRYTNGIKV